MEQLKETKTKTWKAKTEIGKKQNNWIDVVAIVIAVVTASLPFIHIPIPYDDGPGLFGYKNLRLFFLSFGKSHSFFILSLLLLLAYKIPQSLFLKTLLNKMIVPFFVTSSFLALQVYIPRSIWKNGDYPKWMYYIALVVVAILMYKAITSSINLYKSQIWKRKRKLREFLLLDTWGKKGIIHRAINSTSKAVKEKDSILVDELQQDVNKYGSKMAEILKENT